MKKNIFLIIFLIHLCDTKCKACEIQPKAPCIFPFIFENKTYHFCTKVKSKTDESWCATSVDDTGHYKKPDHYWAKCEDFCAPKNIDNEIETFVPVDETSCKFPFIY